VGGSAALTVSFFVHLLFNRRPSRTPVLQVIPT
jgi:hypothetical protein